MNARRRGLGIGLTAAMALFGAGIQAHSHGEQWALANEYPATSLPGEIDAVLSSGDGGAGRKLWDHLPHFSEINYAIPLSFTTVNLDKWKALLDGRR